MGWPNGTRVGRKSYFTPNIFESQGWEAVYQLSSTLIIDPNIAFTGELAGITSILVRSSGVVGRWASCRRIPAPSLIITLPAATTVNPLSRRHHLTPDS